MVIHWGDGKRMPMLQPALVSLCIQAYWCILCKSQLDVDHNADGFLDMPLGETYTIMNNWVWNNSKHTEIRAGAKWTAQDIQEGSFHLIRSRQETP